MPTALFIVAIACTILIPISESVWLDLALMIVTFICLSIRLSSKRPMPAFVFMILTAAPVVTIEKWLEPTIESQATGSVLRTLNNELDIAKNVIDRFFQSNKSALEAIGILVAQNPNVTEEEYHRWLSKVLPQQRNQFINVGLSDDLVLKYVYPPVESNNKIIGTDMRKVPNQGPLYEGAYQTRTPTIIGPVTLLQGMPGIIYVRPVADNKSKIISGVLSLQYLKDELELQISTSTHFSLNISTAVNSLQLVDNLQNNDAHTLLQSLTLDGINVDLSASSQEFDQLIVQTQLITRFSAATFWLVISFIASWQYRSFQERENQREALEERERDLIAAQRLGEMGSWNCEGHGTLKLSEPLRELLNAPTDSITLEVFFDHLHPDEKNIVSEQVRQFLDNKNTQLSLEHRLRVDSDGYHWFEHRIARNQKDQNTGILRDIHSLRVRDEQVAQLESFDSLTGAANRHYFKQIALQNIALCDRRRTALALILVNIDGFRSINEKYGQVSGDELLKQVVHRLQSTSRKTDTVARLSGDTFAISLYDIGNNKQAVLVIEQILRRLKEPYALAEDVYPQFTLGASMFPNDGHDYDTLLRMAESALNNAKSEARGHYRFYSAELSEQTDRRQKILALLPVAIRSNALSLLFQPRVLAARPENTTSMEALVRWHDEHLGFVSPAEFIPIAEQSSLITDIGYWVMEHVFATISTYQSRLPNGLTVSINLSPRQLEDPLLLRNVQTLLERYSVKPCQFELEITEHSISEQSEEIVSNMQLLNDLGFQFAIDDFGTGYSNLGILQNLPLNVLKIDMRFIRAIGSSTKSDKLVKAIVDIGHTLSLKIVAEGVESAAQVHFLRELKCDELQGFYFFKPTKIEQLIPRLIINEILADDANETEY